MVMYDNFSASTFCKIVMLGYSCSFFCHHLSDFEFAKFCYAVECCLWKVMPSCLEAFFERTYETRIFPYR